MFPRINGRNGVRLGASLTLVATATFAGISTASAAPTYYAGDDCGISESSYYDGNYCTGGLFMFYLASGGGASADIVGSISVLSDNPTYAYEGSTLVLQYYTDYEFWGSADSDNTGETYGVRNAVHSVSNSSSSNSYTLYVSPNYTGDAETIGPDTYYENLDSQLINNEASVFEN